MSASHAGKTWLKTVPAHVRFDLRVIYQTDLKFMDSKRSNTVATAGSERRKELCPLLNNPEPDCYCRNSGSQKVSLALYYCQDNYESCNIYQRRTRKAD